MGLGQYNIVSHVVMGTRLKIKTENKTQENSPDRAMANIPGAYTGNKITLKKNSPDKAMVAT